MYPVVHITADFPDAFERKKTLAVRQLLALVPEHTHVVYSLNRVNGVGGAAIVNSSPQVTTIVYRAPPYGLMLERHLAPVGRLICDDLARRKIHPALIHAHKLTVEGIVASSAADAFGCPMICSVWGNTDQKIITKKPFSRATFRAIAQRAHTLLPATPWARDFVLAALGVGAEKTRILPVVSDLKPFIVSGPSANRVVTLLHLDNYAGKNIPSLIKAIGRLRRAGRPVELSIYGGGSQDSQRRLVRIIQREGCGGFISLCGPLERSYVQETLNRYAAFALPSRRETYGMVFIESLFSGVPVLYPQRQSIDGYFETVEVGRKCNARSVESIALELDFVLANEERLKRNIAALHEQRFFTSFGADSIANVYREVVGSALSRACPIQAAPE